MAMSYRHVSVLLPKPPHNQGRLFIVNTYKCNTHLLVNKRYKEKAPNGRWYVASSNPRSGYICKGWENKIPFKSNIQQARINEHAGEIPAENGKRGDEHLSPLRRLRGHDPAHAGVLSGVGTRPPPRRIL